MSIIILSVTQIGLKTSECLPPFFDAVSKTAVIPIVSKNSTHKQSQDVLLELTHHHITFHPDQMRSVQENEENVFCFVLTLTPRQSQVQ